MITKIMDPVLYITLILSVGLVKEIITEDDISEEYEGQDNSSLNSESNEAFNASSRENRIDSDDVSDVENDTVHLNKGISKIAPNSTIGSIEQHDKGNRVSREVNQTISKKPQVNYPFSVSIQRKSSHYSSGALVDRQWVLTAAAEFYNVRESKKLFRARLGSVNCKKGGVAIPIKSIEVHPSYKYNKPAFDIALLRLATPVELNELIAPIVISRVRGRVVSAKFLATYWPRLVIKGEVLPSSAKERVKQTSMRVSTQRMMPWDKCHKVLQKSNVTLEHSSLCLEPVVSHHTPCRPDPGAPVVAKDGLWGITSGWTPPTCTAPAPTIVTRLASPHVMNWLESSLTEM